MIFVDKTGRKIKPGESIVDIMWNGPLQGDVVKIIDQPIMIPGQPPVLPHLIVIATITPRVDPDGMVRSVYIIGDVAEREVMEKKRTSLITGATTH